MSKDSAKSAYPIPEGSDVSYGEFISRDLPTDLREEIALQRTLLRNLLDAMKVNADSALVDVTNEIMADLEKSLKEVKVPEPAAVVILKAFSEKLLAQVRKHVPSAPDTTLLLAVQRAVQSITQTAERMDRIQRGRKIKIQLDNTMLSWLIRNYVVKYVPRDQRPALIEDAKRHGMIVSAGDD